MNMQVGARVFQVGTLLVINGVMGYGGPPYDWWPTL